MSTEHIDITIQLRIPRTPELDTADVEEVCRHLESVCRVAVKQVANAKADVCAEEAPPTCRHCSRPATEAGLCDPCREYRRTRPPQARVRVSLHTTALYWLDTEQGTAEFVKEIPAEVPGMPPFHGQNAELDDGHVVIMGDGAQGMPRAGERFLVVATEVSV